MKSKQLLVIGAVLLFVAGIWWYVRVEASRSKPLAGEASDQSQNTSAPGAATVASNPVGPNTSGTSVTQKTKAELMLEVVAISNTTPINVYGKIVDQYGQPVAQAEIQGGVLINVGLENSGEKKYSTVTDAQGRFQFTGLQGVRFGFIPKKEGYVFDLKADLKWWDKYKPDPNNPAVFTMWKLQGTEPMVHAKQTNRMLSNGQGTVFTVALNPWTGKIDGAGELSVTLTRSVATVRRGVDRYDWEVKIEMRGGGLVETLDPYKNMAADTGYQPVLYFTQKAGDPKWTASLYKDFYVQTAQGRYGRVSLDLPTDSDRPDRGFGTGLILEAWLNPSGSRNLEFDEAKQVKP